VNVLLITSDSMRRDFVGSYGSKQVKTPNIDKLATEGVCFDFAFTGSYPTVPARADVYTGQYVFPLHGWEPFNYAKRPLAAILSEAGVLTELIGDTPHIFNNGFNYMRGFEGWEWIRGQEVDCYRTAPKDVKFPCNPSKLRTPEVYKRHLRNTYSWRYESDRFCAQSITSALRWLEENYKYSPWFLDIELFDPHEPWDPPQYYVDMYDPGYEGEVIPYPQYGKSDYLSPSELNHIRALYSGELTMVDRWIGILLECLDYLGIRGETIVIFWSDHGFLLGEHGLIGKGLNPLYNEMLRIPFIISHPEGLSGIRCDTFVQPCDITATILDIYKLSIPEDMHGKSLLPLLKGELNYDIRDLAISSWKLPPDNFPDGEVVSFVTTREWSLHYYGVDGNPHLYNNLTDSAQVSDLINEYPDIAKELHLKYVDFLKSIACPPEQILFVESYYERKFPKCRGI